MTHTFLQDAQYRVKGWVKNANSFANKHPFSIVMATGSLVGAGLYAVGRSRPNADMDAADRAAAERLASERAAFASEARPRREAVASSNTFSERSVLLGNMRAI